jgi:hypothetical protein
MATDPAAALLSELRGLGAEVHRLGSRISALLRSPLPGGDLQETVQLDATSNNAPQFALHANARRTKLEIQNLSTSDVEWGDPNLIRQGVKTFGKHRRIPAGVAYTDDSPACYKGAVAILANVVGPLDVRVSEEFMSAPSQDGGER